jgi:hypothetical protein
VAASEAKATPWESVHSAYRPHFATVSLLVPPWCLIDLTRRTSAEVERQVQAETRAIEAFIAMSRVPVKKKTLDQVRKQLTGWSTLIDLWWQGDWHNLPQVALTPRWTRWVEELLLPLMHGQKQMSCPHRPRRKAKLLQALEAVRDAFHTHPRTE